MTTHILVTGGAGYIGAVMVPLLLQRGYQVTVLDRFDRGDAALADCCHYEGFQPVRGDVRDHALVAGLVAHADIVLPLAALVGAPLCDLDPSNAEAINRDAVIDLCKLIGDGQRLIFPCTNSGYGAATGICSEDMPQQAVSLYATTKLAAEQAVLQSGNGISLRLATVFGLSPRMRTDLLVNDFTLRAVSDGSLVLFEGQFKRNFIHLRDVAKAFLHAIDHYQAMNNQPFNVGLSNANLSKIELCQRIKRQLPDFTYIEADVGKDPDQRNYVVSNDKFEATGWAADWTLDQGIAELIKGYRMLRLRNFSNV